MRLLAVSIFLQSRNRTQVANQLKVARSSVNSWVSNYLEQGLVGLEDKQRPGKRPSLSNDQKRCPMTKSGGSPDILNSKHNRMREAG